MDFFLEKLVNVVKTTRNWVESDAGCMLDAYNQNTNHTRHSKLLSKDDEQCYFLFYFIFKIILIEHILNAQTWFHHIITTVMIHIILVIQHRNL